MLRGTPDVQLNIFPDFIHKKGFSIYDPLAVCNLTEKLAQNKYIYVYDLRILLSFSITVVPWVFEKL